MSSVELALVRRITFLLLQQGGYWRGVGEVILSWTILSWTKRPIGYMGEADQGWCCGSGRGSLVMGFASDARLNGWYLLANAGKGLSFMSCLSGECCCAL